MELHVEGTNRWVVFAMVTRNAFNHGIVRRIRIQSDATFRGDAGIISSD